MTREDIARLASRCALCAKCQSVCPVFAGLGDEARSARGRIALAGELAAGGLPAGESLDRALSTCTFCLRCEECCPSGVEVERVTLEALRLLRAELPLPSTLQHVFRDLLPHPKLFRDAVRNAPQAATATSSGRRGISRHLPVAVAGLAEMPDLAPSDFLEIRRNTSGGPKTGAGPRSKRPVIGFFAGCLLNHVYPDTAMNCIRLLELAGFDVVVPDDQTCCGAPAYFASDTDSARQAAAANFQAFASAGCSTIVAACAACRIMLKDVCPALLEDCPGRWPEIKDISEVLAGRIEVPHEKRVLAYHGPIRMYRDKEMKESVRTLFSCLPSGGYFGEDECCGAGLGLFGCANPQLAERMASDVLALALRSRPQAIVVSCPGCRLQLEHAAGREQRPAVILHIADLLAESAVPSE